jgi:hypothetical protein
MSNVKHRDGLQNTWKQDIKEVKCSTKKLKFLSSRVRGKRGEEKHNKWRKTIKDYKI